MGTKRSGQIALTIVMGAFLASACCENGGGSVGSATATTITFESDDFFYSPKNWSFAADTDVTVTMENIGKNQHEWAVLKLGTTISSEDEFREDMVELELEAIQRDTVDTITVNLPPGEYQVICALTGHFDQGMEGTLTVGGEATS